MDEPMPSDDKDDKDDDNNGDKDDDDEVMDNDDQNVLDPQNWGRKKSSYYHGDITDLEIGQDENVHSSFLLIFYWLCFSLVCLSFHFF